VATYDVGVVGAGVHGAAVAFHLATRGIRAVIVERDGPAAGPTGRSSAICRAYYTNAFLASVARDSIAMMASFVDHTGRSAEFRRTGMLFLHHPRTPLPSATRSMATLSGSTELSSPIGCPSASGISPTGIAVPRGTRRQARRSARRHVGPVRARPRARRAARLGSPVIAITTTSAGGGELITDSGERISCGRILLAAGPWTASLAGHVGVELPLHAERHVVATFGGPRGALSTPR
jgi:glycine/D-amino acid oxidase-like deaminating enzyme